MLFDLSELEGPVPGDTGLLGDEDARRAISNDLGSTLFVEAGAGSGKTSAMVERIIQLIRRSDVELREIAAVTFTEAAGAELRARVRRRLASSAALDGAGSPAAVALAQIDEAAIGTIHGFCQRLLAEHPLEAGLPPGFVVLDEVRGEHRVAHPLGGHARPARGRRGDPPARRSRLGPRDGPSPPGGDRPGPRRAVGPL